MVFTSKHRDPPPPIPSPIAKIYLFSSVNPVHFNTLSVFKKLSCKHAPKRTYAYHYPPEDQPRKLLCPGWKHLFSIIATASATTATTTSTMIASGFVLLFIRPPFYDTAVPLSSFSCFISSIISLTCYFFSSDGGSREFHIVKDITYNLRLHNCCYNDFSFF